MTLALFFLWDSTAVKLRLYKRDTVWDCCLGGGINYNRAINRHKGLHCWDFRGWGRNFFVWAVNWVCMSKTFHFTSTAVFWETIFFWASFSVNLFHFKPLHTQTLCSLTFVQRCTNPVIYNAPGPEKSCLAPFACHEYLSVCDEPAVMAPVGQWCTEAEILHCLQAHKLLAFNLQNLSVLMFCCIFSSMEKH